MISTNGDPLRKVAVLDLDDTVGDMRSPLCVALNNYSGKAIHWTDWHTFRIEKLYGMTHGEFLSVLERSKIIENMVPHSESKLFTETLKAHGFHIVLATARAWHPRAKIVTTNWLERHGIVYDDLIICDLTENKAETVSNIYNCVEFTVDDSPSRCNEYADNSNVASVFVYDMPWNQVSVNRSCRRIHKLDEIPYS